jgi:hypothetical protein
LASKLAWTEAERFPYYAGTWRSPEEVVEKLFLPLGREWTGFTDTAKILEAMQAA